MPNWPYYSIPVLINQTEEPRTWPCVRVQDELLGDTDVRVPLRVVQVTHLELVRDTLVPGAQAHP